MVCLAAPAHPQLTQTISADSFRHHWTASPSELPLPGRRLWCVDLKWKSFGLWGHDPPHHSHIAAPPWGLGLWAEHRKGSVNTAGVLSGSAAHLSTWKVSIVMLHLSRVNKTLMRPRLGLLRIHMQFFVGFCCQSNESADIKKKKKKGFFSWVLKSPNNEFIKSAKDDLMSSFAVNQHKSKCWLLMHAEHRYHHAGMCIQQAAASLPLTFKASLSTKCSTETI